MNALTRELIEGYASLFVGCWDYYAVQQRDGSYRPSYQSLTLSRLADHLQGRYTLGAYVLDGEGMCSSCVFDADGEDGLDRLVLLAGELAAQGISSVMEASRRGGHLWVFLVERRQAWMVRAWLLPYAERYGVEFYPKQDGLRVGGMGSLVRLPLGVHRRSGERYPLMEVGANGKLYAVGETVQECCVWLHRHAERVRVPAEVVSEVGNQEQMGVVMSAGKGAIRRWCMGQDIVEVIGRYTHLDGRGVGRCPLPGHHDRGDERPSFQVFGGTDPHWYCYTWKRAGNLFDFLCVYHGWTVREGWQRLQQGVL